MTDTDILRQIASAFSERKSSAALSNYLVLSNNIKYVNDVLRFAVHVFSGIESAAGRSLGTPANCTPDYREAASRAPFTQIIPRVVANGLAVLDKFILHTAPDDRGGVTVENVSKLHRGFMDYNGLVTATRQVVDSLVSDAYQMCLLEPKALNYHVLVSLNSFDRYVTPSIRQALFTKETSDALAAFRKLSFREWANSAITRCAEPNFGQKVEFLFRELGITSEQSFAEELKDIFKFSSEFTHIGYVSTFFSSSQSPEVIFGDEIGPYLPSTENFSELKYRILETATRLLALVYLPSVARAWQKMLETNACKPFAESLDGLVKEMQEHLKTRNAQYYFFIKSGLTKTDKVIELPCICGAVRRWAPPHESDDLYCKGCGSHFNLMELDGDGGYVITSSGPVRIIGSEAPEFKDLPVDEQMKLMREVDTLMRKKPGP
jgi:hypothetical protein